MPMYEVRELDASEFKVWDEFIKSSPHGSVYHLTDWLKIYKEVLNQDFRIYGCFLCEELVGGCSLFIKHNIMEQASSTFDLTPFGGVAIKKNLSDSIRKQFKEDNEIINAIREVLEEKYSRIKMNLSPAFTDIRPFTWNAWSSNVLYTYNVNLEKYEIKRISRNIRDSAKHALKEGISVKKKADPDIHYDLFRMVFEGQNVKPIINREFFDKALNLIKSKDIGDAWVAETSTGEFIASHIRLWDNKRAYAWSDASNPSFKKINPNSLLYLEEFMHFKGEGFKEINMLMGNVPRFAEFMTSFNPELVPYYSINYGTRNYILKYLRNRIKSLRSAQPKD